MYCFRYVVVVVNLVDIIVGTNAASSSVLGIDLETKLHNYSENNDICTQFHITTECTPLKSCPVLKKQFEDGKNNPRIIKFFQKLICGFEIDSPMICCPSKAVSHNITQRNKNSSFLDHEHFRLIPSLKDCGLTPLVDRIIGGDEALIGAHPWLTRIGYKVARVNDIQYGCAGSIISHRYVLTAAHCFHGIGSMITPEEVRLAEYDSSKNPDCFPESGCQHVKDVKIEKVLVHPLYNPSSKLNDIALIRLAEEISFKSITIQPICLPFMNLEDTMNATHLQVAGWGKTHWKAENGSSILQQIQLPLISNDDCQNWYALKTKFKIMDTQICAGGELGRDACSGDSGGAGTISLKDSVGRAVQVGVVSYGANHCGDKDSPPGVFTNVSKYLQWILDTIEP